MNPTKLIMIAAVASNGVIGKDGGLPWHIKEDLKHFKTTTAGSPLIMGRLTYESMPKSVWLDRQPFVLSHNPDILEASNPGIIAGRSLSSLTKQALEITTTGYAFIIGGVSLFEQGFECADELIISRLNDAYEGDVYMPEIPDKFHKTSSDLRYDEFVVERYVRYNHE